MSCVDPSAAEDLVTVRYQQTYCADPWSPSGSISDPAEFSDAATRYVQSTFTIPLRNVRTEDRRATDAAVCHACTCTSGLSLYAEATALQARALTEAGFQQR